MSRSMRVTVVLEFNNVESTESEIADIIIQNITASTDEMREVFNADAVWLDDAEIHIEYGKRDAARAPVDLG